MCKYLLLVFAFFSANAFLASAQAETPTMIPGWTYDSDGNTATSLYGFARGSFGTMSQTTTSNNKTYEGLWDRQECNAIIFTCDVSSAIAIGGWTSDPGKAWLNYASAYGNTKNGASAVYNYRNGVASWSWFGESFGFWSFQPTVITLSHN